MPKSTEFRFTIDGYTPDTLPTARLALYLAELADMLGSTSSVHFVKIEEGSAVLVNKIDQPAVPQVEKRLRDVVAGTASVVVMRAYHSLNERLREDNSTGTLTGEQPGVVVRFPGIQTPMPKSYGPFNQEGSLDGRVIVIGGTGDPVPVHLQQGEAQFNCLASRDLARDLGGHLFSDEVRMFGTGRWLLNESGSWELKSFIVKYFEILHEVALPDALAELRAVEGSKWKDVADPWSALLSMREESRDTH
jgi:hypothetical protein